MQWLVNILSVETPTIFARTEYNHNLAMASLCAVMKDLLDKNNNLYFMPRTRMHSYRHWCLQIAAMQHIYLKKGKSLGKYLAGTWCSLLALLKPECFSECIIEHWIILRVQLLITCWMYQMGRNDVQTCSKYIEPDH